MIRTRFATLGRGLFIPALIVGLLGLGPSLHIPVHAAGDCTVSSAELPPDQEEQNLLNEINRYRSSPYVWSNTLSRAAVWQARDMANRDIVSHIDSLSRTFPTRLADCGHSPTIPAGENVTAGRTQYYGDTNTLSYWMFQTADWHNIVGTEFTHAGIAHVYNALSTQKNFWVLVVGVEGSAPSAATPTRTPTRTPTNASSPPTPTWTPSTLGTLSASYDASPPTSWKSGQTRNYSVTVTNTGTATWNATGSNYVQLGVHFGTTSDVPAVGWATDQRFRLPHDVAPGGSVTLRVWVTAPAAGSYVLRQRMGKEQVAWFAQIHKTSVTVRP